MKPSLFAVALPLVVATVGCSSTDGDPSSTEKPIEGENTPLYALMYEVFDDVGSTSYLSVIDSLDRGDIEPGTSDEYAGGRAFLRTYNGWVFVGDAASPTVTRYSVSDSGALTKEDSLSFADYGLQAGEIDDWTTTFVSPTKAYTVLSSEGTTIVWNPTTMSLTGEIAAPENAIRRGYTLEGSPGAVRGNRLFRTFDWVNTEDEYLEERYLAVYDTDSDELIDMVEEKRCHAMGNRVNTDESGNLYFSNWIWTVPDTLMRGANSSCVLRIGPESERFDPDFSFTYTDVTGGREGAMFAYLGDDKAVFSAFYDEETSFDASTDAYEYASAQLWRLWSYDMASGEAAPLEGLEANSGAFTPVHFDGRSFALVPGVDWAATQVHELEGGRATPAFSVPGWTYQFVQIRK